MFVSEQNETTILKSYIMKLKAVLFAAAIFGASFFVTSTPEENVNKDEIKEQAVQKSKIRIPSAG